MENPTLPLRTISPGNYRSSDGRFIVIVVPSSNGPKTSPKVCLVEGHGTQIEQEFRNWMDARQY